MTVRQVLSTIRGNRTPNIDFIGRRRWWFALSGLVILVSIVGLVGPGLNFSIAFEGGAQLQYPNRTGVSVGEIQRTLARYGRQQAQVEILGDEQVSVRTETLTDLGLRADRLRQDLARQAGISPNEINEQDVGPTWGATISRKALTGLVVFLVLVSLYISARFEPKMAGGALAALLHDLTITAGIYAVTGREVTPETVIAVLTILGYSLYDSVVIFDKIKENTESVSLVARETYSGVTNLSLNQVFMRSVNTSLTTLLPVGALLLFGGQTLKDFAFALFVGIATGTYSSVFIGAPILAILKEREPRNRQIRARAAARAGRPGLRVAGAPEEPAVGRRQPTEGSARAERPDEGLQAVRVPEADVEETEATGTEAAGAARGPRAGATGRPGAPGTKRKKPRSQGKAKRRRR